MNILYMASLPVRELRRIGKKESSIHDNYEHFLFPLFAYMLENGNVLSIVTASRDIKNEEEYQSDNLFIRIVPLCNHGNVSALLEFRNDINKIKRAMRGIDYDLVHVHWCYEYAMAALETDPDHTVITLHDWPDKVCPAFHNFYWNRRNVLGNRVLSMGRHFIAVSPYISGMLRDNYNHDSYIMPNSIDERVVECFRASGKEKNKNGNNFRIIEVANGFNELKNTKTAIRAFSAFHEKNQNAEFYIYGFDHGKGEAAELWAKREGISTDGIVFCGQVDRQVIYDAFRKADVLLHLSREESFGIVYLEALASGLRIVAGKNSGATPWVLNELKNAYLVDVDDEKLVSNALKQVYQDGRVGEAELKSLDDYLRDRFWSSDVFAEYNAYTKSFLTMHS